MSRVFAKYGLRWDIEVSYGRVGGDERYPYCTVDSIIQGLDRVGRLHQIMGLGNEIDTMSKARPILEEHWRRYAVNYGDHQVFELARQGRIDLGCAVPCFLHGDEGTTFKKDGCLVLSLQASFGKGTLTQKLGDVASAGSGGMQMNFAGHAFQTRFLLGALLRDTSLK